MANIIKALILTQKAFKPKLQKPKLTPGQFIKKQKILVKIAAVLTGYIPVTSLIDPVNQFNQDIAQTLAKQIAKNSRPPQ
ncbi:MAG: hypothetical protein CENE_01201 [Candidatus Celerinatantimonas neptuna]|nr:MAG: hypothetical protein CENE_01201 [Candidatus Celerinatantimonas neptuna]